MRGSFSVFLAGLNVHMLGTCHHFDWVWSWTGISPEVNELLMEAQLLQVSLPEIQELYQTLLAKPSPVSQTDRSSPVRPSSEKVSVLRGSQGAVCSGDVLSVLLLSVRWRKTVFDPQKDASWLLHSSILKGAGEMLGTGCLLLHPGSCPGIGSF